MVITRSSRTVVSKMIAQFNQIVRISSFVQVKPLMAPNPSFIPSGVQCLRSSTVFQNSKLSQTVSIDSVLSNRVSRVARSMAEDALFDYLYCTRSLSFADAEHISKNSPLFVQGLLSRIDSEEDVAKSLSKFFRYNPINEFEPFFESLGLHPSEISSFLPRHLMFLSDDSVMLENFHLLCDYGFPRTSIGKMFKEAKEVFGYDHGVLARKLRDYEKLGLSKSSVIKVVSSSTLLLVGGVNCDFVKVLEILRGLGFGNDWMVGYLSSQSTWYWNRILDTFDILEKVGYSKEHMRNLIKKNPAILFGGSGKMIHVLFGRFLKCGLKTNDIYSIIEQNSQVLAVRRVKNILRATDFLFETRMGVQDIANIVSSHIGALSSCSLRGVRTVCKDLGVERSRLSQIIKEDPLKFFSIASKSQLRDDEPVASLASGNQLEKTKFLLRLGYTENSDEMMKALKKFRGRGEDLQERFDCLVEAGLDCNVVSDIIKQSPTVLNQSRDVIQKKIDCLRNCLGYPMESMIAFPIFLGYDLERIKRRFSMYAWLRKKDAAKPNLTLSTILACSDVRFEKYFVNIHPEGPAIWENLKRSSPSASS